MLVKNLIVWKTSTFYIVIKTDTAPMIFPLDKINFISWNKILWQKKILNDVITFVAGKTTLYIIK